MTKSEVRRVEISRFVLEYFSIESLLCLHHTIVDAIWRAVQSVILSLHLIQYL